MIYSQIRENEQTARYDVRVLSGHRCEIELTDPAEAKTARKKIAAPTWRIAGKEEPSWVDLEGELNRIEQRTSLDYSLPASGEGTAQLRQRLEAAASNLYSSASLDDYLAYLALLNIFEYFRIYSALERLANPALSAETSATMGEEYLACRRTALELDLAELIEWLISHDIGLPNRSLFIHGAEPLVVMAEPIVEEKPKRKTRKKIGEDQAAATEAGPAAEVTAEAEAASEPIQQMPTVMPASVYYIAELIRLHQATITDLVRMTGRVMDGLKLSEPSEAIRAMCENVAPWLDTEYALALYNQQQHDARYESQMEHNSIERQKEMFDQKPKRGVKGDNGKVESAKPDKTGKAEQGGKLQLKLRPTPADEFEYQFEEESTLTYEQAMERALGRPEGAEFMPDEFDNSETEAPSRRTRNDHGDEVEMMPDEYEESSATKPQLGVQGKRGRRRRNRKRDEGGAGQESFSMGDDAATESNEPPQSEPFIEGEATRPNESQNERPQTERPQGERTTGDGRNQNDRGGRSRQSGRRDNRGKGGRNERHKSRSTKGRSRSGGGRNVGGSSGGNKGGGRMGGGNIDFDSVQPISNDTPGLVPPAVGGNRRRR